MRNHPETRASVSDAMGKRNPSLDSRVTSALGNRSSNNGWTVGDTTDAMASVDAAGCKSVHQTSIHWRSQCTDLHYCTGLRSERPIVAGGGGSGKKRWRVQRASSESQQAYCTPESGPDRVQTALLARESQKMPLLLSSTLAQTPPNQHFLLLQSSTAQSCLPVLRAIVKRASERTRESTILFCFLYPPSSFLDPSRIQPDHIRVVDRTANVPGYDDVFESAKNWIAALKSEILETVRSGMSSGQASTIRGWPTDP